MSRIFAKEEGQLAQDSYQSRKRTGANMLVALIVLTVVEFAIAIGLNGPIMLAGLAIFAVLDAWFIAEYFMHLHQLRRHVAEAWHAVTRGVRD
ncbi:MAG: cytochrome C oxidase subunit IV family protein [Chloroflexi bacterium]|nr:cytochrome C oxidase subunit IV family protein [Chloroflexota bacterium]